MQQKTETFLSKITRIEVAGIVCVLLFIPFIKAIYEVLYWCPGLPASVGVFCPIVLNLAGTAIGISTISKSTSGGAVRSPALVMKSLLGIVLCEANLIFSSICFFFLSAKATAMADREKNMTLKDVQEAWCILASGLTCGLCGMISSLGSSVVNSSSSISIANNAKMFSKLISLQLIVGGVGIFGTIMSLFFLKLPWP